METETLKNPNDDNSAESVEYNSQQVQTDGPPSKKQKSIWTQLGPRIKGSLFYEIVSSKNAMNPIRFWLDLYESDQVKGINELIQLFMDVSSYQNVKIHSFLLHNEYSSIIPYLEDKLSTPLLETGKYFLKVETIKFSASVEKLSNFMIVLIEQCYKNRILYDLLKICIKIWKQMSESKIRAIKHTGVFFALKCQTGLIIVLIYLIKKLQHLNEALQSDVNFSKKDTYLMKKEDYLYSYKHINSFIIYIHRGVFYRNCNFNDAELGLMREQCIQELGKWMNILPDRFLSCDFVNILTEGLSDRDRKVRYVSLQTLNNILQNVDFKSKLEKNIKNIGINILDRIFDVDMKVAVLAVNVISFINKHYKPVSSGSRDKIFIKVYSFHCDLAIACGEFLAHHIRASSHNDADLFLKILNFHIISQKRGDVKDKVALLVEALIDYIPELKNLEIYVKLLGEMVKQKAEEHFVTVLFEILIEVIQIVCFGICSFRRTGYKLKQVNKAEADKLIQDVWNALQTLHKLFDHSKLYPLLILIKDFQAKNLTKLKN